MALLNFEMQTLRRPDANDLGDEEGRPQKSWTAYLPLLGVVLLILTPQPSIIILCTRYYLLIQDSKIRFLGHLGVSYMLCFMMICSLIVCLARDPGPVTLLGGLEQENTAPEPVSISVDEEEESDDEISLGEALMRARPTVSSHAHPERSALTSLKADGEPRWCRKCWAPKPERTHHCSECGVCVLKMDHHCPWLAQKCIGFRTYPAFVHFLFSVTLFSVHGVYLSVSPIKYYLNAFELNESDMTPYHAMSVALMGCIFALSIGSFFTYHVYLILTNQTTLESLAPYLILRYLPPLPRLHSRPASPETRPPSFSSSPPSPVSTAPSLPPASPPPYAVATRRSQRFEDPYSFPSPPDIPRELDDEPRRIQEHELTSKQRRRVRDAGGRIRLYDLGWKENVKEALGGPGKRGTSSGRLWILRLFFGGRGTGDGRNFRFNPRAEQQLTDLAAELATLSS